MKEEIPATIVKTANGMIHIIVGIEANYPTGIDGKIPTMMISIKKKGGVKIVKNPEKEMLSLGPNGALNDQFNPKSINLVGVHYPPEVITSVCTVECEIIEPTYTKL